MNRTCLDGKVSDGLITETASTNIFVSLVIEKFQQNLFILNLFFRVKKDEFASEKIYSNLMLVKSGDIF